ncbi:MAG TPA: hypothetical protein VL359_14230 [bacterium]|nr:hypothetical protein [bacterium]
MKLILLAQAQTQPAQAPSLTDLSWLRFPVPTAGQYVGFGVVLLIIVVSVVVTLFLQGMWQRWRDSSRRRRRRHGSMILQRLEPELQALARQLAQALPGADAGALVQDVRAFETAVEHAMNSASGVDPAQVTRLRRELQMTVMNPHAEIVSTRQLLTDMPVSLTATAGDERLELYCSLLEVNEHALLIDVPYDHEVHGLLTMHPEVVLAYWREGRENPAFKLRLQPLQAGKLSAFRSQHAMLAPEIAQRMNFRLAMDVPVNYHFLSREQLAAYHQTHRELPTAHGQGRLVDLSESGAALVTPQALPTHGLAQLHFDLKGAAVRVMWEPLEAGVAHGGHLIHGRFRGLAQEQRSVIHSFLVKEQFKRVKMRESIHVSMAQAEPGEAPTPAAHGSGSAPHGDPVPVAHGAVQGGPSAAAHGSRAAPHGAPGPATHGAARPASAPGEAALQGAASGKAEPPSPPAAGGPAQRDPLSSGPEQHAPGGASGGGKPRP